MKPVDLLRFSWGALYGHRLRTILSISGVGVGIAAVIALTALGEGARTYVTSEFSSLGSNLLIVLPGKVETTGVVPYGGVTHDLTLADYSAIVSRLPRIKSAAPIAVATDSVRFGERNRNVPILGTTRQMMEVRKLKLGSGDFLPARDPNESGNEIVLGAKVARELFRGKNPLGNVVKMGNWRFRVVGVLMPKGRSLGFDMDDVVIVPVRSVMQAFNRHTLFRILCEVRSHREIKAAKADVLALLKARHRAEDVTVITQGAVLAAFSRILHALTLVLAGIAGISLAVAGVGIMNLMLVSVSERRTEIGLLKALGATNRQVLSAFLADAFLLTMAGGAAGVAAGIATARIFSRIYPDFPVQPPVWAIVASLAMSLFIGVVFGLWPAYRATRLDPVAALSSR